jgi:hypothetical protein
MMGEESEYRNKILKDLMRAYDSKSRSWEYETSDFDEEVEEDGFWEVEEDDGYTSDFAVILMDELTTNNLDSHVLLKYPKIADWWGGILKERKKKAEALRKREEARRKKEEDARARESLLARLTPEERRLLGVK